MKMLKILKPFNTKTNRNKKKRLPNMKNKNLTEDDIENK